MGRLWMAALAAVSIVLATFACGGEGTHSNGSDDSGTTIMNDDGGTQGDGGTDAGPQLPDAGPVPEDAGPGPWPTDRVANYSLRYNAWDIQSVGVDDAFNIWLLHSDAIGVLRPGSSGVVWTSGIGQAAGGFGEDKAALGSTVICGGSANVAYVGYWASDANQGHVDASDDPKLSKGDLDVVQVHEDGTVSLFEHLNRSTGTSKPWPPANVGIRNSNNWQYNEDVSVLTCQKVMKGRDRGEVYIGTNHGVTRIRGLEYCSHRHPIWITGEGTPQKSENIGYSFGLGVGQNGEILIANEWKVGIVDPPAELGKWEFFADMGGPAWGVDTYNQELNSLAEFDFWRAMQQTTDGLYYLGSSQFGLWRMERTQWVDSENWFKVDDLPSNSINALAATEDGSLFIGTNNAGLWRMDPDKVIERFTDIPGGRVQQLVYDPTVTPATLYVLIDGGLHVLRGY